MKKIILGILVLGLLGGGFAYMQFNKEHRDIAAEEASVQVSSTDLFNAYVADEVAANAKYLDKVVEVSGVITELNMDAGSEMVVLQTSDDFFGVNVYFDDVKSLDGLTAGKSIRIKGHCTGGDEMGVVMAECAVLN